MSAPSDTAPAPSTRRPLSTGNKVGLALAGLLGVLDVTSVPGGPMSPEPAPGETGPPAGVLWFDVVMGLITLVAVVVAWRTGSRAASRVVAAARIASIFTALPAFFADGVPAFLVALVAVAVLVTAAAVFLVLRRPPVDAGEPA